MSELEDLPEEDSFLRRAFPPGLQTWGIAILFGMVLPFVFEGVVVSNLGALSMIPQTMEVKFASTAEQGVAMLTLWSLFALYVFIFGYQLWLAIKARRFSFICAIIVTVVSVPFMWLVIPFIQ